MTDTTTPRSAESHNQPDPVESPAEKETEAQERSQAAWASTRAPNQPPASLGEQLGRTKSSFQGLLGAHMDLLRAEIAEIIDQVKVIGTLAGAMLGIALLVGNMLYIGGFLFLGEWLFGSIGWGLAHGLLFGIGLITALGLVLLGAGAGKPVVALLIAAVLMIGVALLLGTNIAFSATSGLAMQMPAPVNTPGAVALIAGAVAGALLFAVLLFRVAGSGGAVGGLVIGAAIGALAGWLIGGAPWTWPPAVGFAITLGLIAWPILGLVVALPGLDPGERFSKLYPKQSIEAANETKEWLEEQWRKRQPKLGRK